MTLSIDQRYRVALDMRDVLEQINQELDHQNVDYNRVVIGLPEMGTALYFLCYEEILQATQAKLDASFASETHNART